MHKLRTSVMNTLRDSDDSLGQEEENIEFFAYLNDRFLCVPKENEPKERAPQSGAFSRVGTNAAGM